MFMLSLLAIRVWPYPYLPTYFPGSWSRLISLHIGVHFVYLNVRPDLVQRSGQRPNPRALTAKLSPNNFLSHQPYFFISCNKKKYRSIFLFHEAMPALHVVSKFHRMNMRCLLDLKSIR